MQGIIVGLGCDRGTHLQTLAQALNQALERVDLEADLIVGFATIDKKADEESILGLVRGMRLPLNFYSAEELAQVEVPNPSEVVLKYMGTPAVSEAAAILMAKGDRYSLLLEKFKFKGTDGKNATISIAKVK